MVEKEAAEKEAGRKVASVDDLKAVFDHNDLHTFIKEYMPGKISLLLKTLILTEDANTNYAKVEKFITIITKIQANVELIANKIKELLNTKYGLSTNESPDNIINQLIQHYKTKYCNVTEKTPLEHSLRFKYTSLTTDQALLGGAKCRTKRRKLSKRLQTKKRRV